MMGDKIQEEDGSDDSGNPDNSQIVYSSSNNAVGKLYISLHALLVNITDVLIAGKW